LADEFPNVYEIVHDIPELSTRLVDLQELSLKAAATGRSNPFLVLPAFTFREVDRAIPAPDSRIDGNHKPTVAIMYLAHDGGWPYTIRVSILGAFVIVAFFELTRRVFYYVMIGGFKPSE
jgi:hypothetical protein